MNTSLNNEINILRQVRKNILGIINLYSEEALNFIPEGFNNNLIWNAAHVVATQQLLVYRLSKRTIDIDEKWIDRFRKGTKPEGIIGEEEIKELKDLLLSTVDKMKEDYDNGAFTTFDLYSTSFGIDLESVETAVSFNNVHEGMHFGYMLALRKELMKANIL